MELSYPHAPWNCSNLEPWFVYLCSCFCYRRVYFRFFPAHFLNSSNGFLPFLFLFYYCLFIFRHARRSFVFPSNRRKFIL